MRDFGHIRIKVNEVIEKSGMTKSKICQRGELERTQLNNYCNNKITRLDTDVLARMCTVLNCEIKDILEFIPSDKKDGE